jgi:glutamyl-tRNA synthetase
MSVTTRFAPSPTGYLHIGGARTALFCWLYARRHGGRFVLRVEDTDRERSTPEAINAILEGMSWLGIDYDEGPLYQTERFARYGEVIDRMLEEGTAYRCYCSRERLDQLRADQQARKVKPRYDGRCRHLTERPADAEGDPVIRFRQPHEGHTVVDDQVKGRVAFDNAELDDLIIARADGSPTYNFVVVVDDMDMGISHVIRGDDHLNNSARQANILKALGVEPPVYAHVPMILDAQGKKLSKRTGAASVMEYRDAGYLPEAVINYLVRLGWAHGDQEVFTLDELIEYFDIGEINHSASSLNPSKLDWLNQHYLKTLPPAHVARHFAWHLGALGIDPGAADAPNIEAVVSAQAERSKTLVEMAENSRFLYTEPQAYDEKAARKHLLGAGDVLDALTNALAEVEHWKADAIHQAITGVAEEQGLKMGKVAQPLRVAVSGGPVSPPIDITLELLGREAVLRRLVRAREWVDQSELDRH